MLLLFANNYGFADGKLINVVLGFCFQEIKKDQLI